MGIKITGLDELSRSLKQLQRNAEKLNGTHQVTLSELFTPGFLAAHSRFSNISDFFQSGGFDFQSQEDFENVDPRKLDEYVASVTDFENWDAMKAAAGKQYAIKKLGL